MSALKVSDVFGIMLVTHFDDVYVRPLGCTATLHRGQIKIDIGTARSGPAFRIIIRAFYWMHYLCITSPEICAYGFIHWFRMLRCLFVMAPLSLCHLKSPLQRNQGDLRRP